MYVRLKFVTFLLFMLHIRVNSKRQLIFTLAHDYKLAVATLFGPLRDVL